MAAENLKPHHKHFMHAMHIFVQSALTVLCLMTLPSCSPKEQVRSSENLNYSDAVAWNEDLCLPHNARAVFVYELISGTQDLERFYRFTVNPSELNAAIQEATSICDSKMRRKYKYLNGKLNSSVYNWPNWASKKIKWWKPHLISSGLYCVTSEAYGLRIWGDIQNGVVYVYQGD